MARDAKKGPKTPPTPAPENALHVSSPNHRKKSRTPSLRESSDPIGYGTPERTFKDKGTVIATDRQYWESSGRETNRDCSDIDNESRSPGSSISYKAIEKLEYRYPRSTAENRRQTNLRLRQENLRLIYDRDCETSYPYNTQRSLEHVDGRNSYNRLMATIERSRDEYEEYYVDRDHRDSDYRHIDGCDRKHRAKGRSRKADVPVSNSLFSEMLKNKRNREKILQRQHLKDRDRHITNSDIRVLQEGVNIDTIHDQLRVPGIHGSVVKQELPYGLQYSDKTTTHQENPTASVHSTGSREQSRLQTYLQKTTHERAVESGSCPQKLKRERVENQEDSFLNNNITNDVGDGIAVRSQMMKDLDNLKHMDDSLLKQIKDLTNNNEELKKAMQAKQNDFESELKKKADVYAIDLFALQKCKEKLKGEKYKVAELEKAMMAKKLECKKLNDQIAIMHEAFSRMKSEVKTKTEATSPSQTLSLRDDERNAYENKIHCLNEVLDNYKAALSYKVEKLQTEMNNQELSEEESQHVSAQFFKSLKRISHGLQHEERQRYKEEISILKQNLDQFKAAIIVDNVNSDINNQQHSDEYKKTKVHLQEMTSQNYLLDSFAKKMTREKRDTEEKLSAASKQIHEMVKQNTTNAVELKSSQFRLNICTDDLHQEKKKVKMLEIMLNEKNNWIGNEQKKCSDLQTTIQLKNKKIEELKISCTSLETDVTQLMNELRRLEDEPDTNP